MGKMQRRKGKTWEQAVARMYREHGVGAERRGWHQAHGMSDEPDVRADVAMAGYAAIHNECKAGKQTNPRAALSQAEEAAQAAHLPVAVCKDDRKPPMVLLRLSAWLQICAALAQDAAPVGADTGPPLLTVQGDRHMMQIAALAARPPTKDGDGPAPADPLGAVREAAEPLITALRETRSTVLRNHARALERALEDA